MRDFYLTVALVLGLVVGYLAGSRERGQIAPINYDPARAIIGDALKTQSEQTEKCWEVTVDALVRLQGGGPRSGPPSSTP